jgi:hypothetical protein
MKRSIVHTRGSGSVSKRSQRHTRLELDCLKQSSVESEGQAICLLSARGKSGKMKRSTVHSRLELDCFKQSSLDEA